MSVISNSRTVQLVVCNPVHVTHWCTPTTTPSRRPSLNLRVSLIAGELRLAGIARNDRIPARRSSPASLGIVPIVLGFLPRRVSLPQSRKDRASIPHHKTDVAVHVERWLIALVDGEHEPLGTTLPGLLDGKAYNLLAVTCGRGLRARHPCRRVPNSRPVDVRSGSGNRCRRPPRARETSCRRRTAPAPCTRRSLRQARGAR